VYRQNSHNKQEQIKLEGQKERKKEKEIGLKSQQEVPSWSLGGKQCKLGLSSWHGPLINTVAKQACIMASCMHAYHLIHFYI
jgi:hypothetical protein